MLIINKFAVAVYYEVYSSGGGFFDEIGLVDPGKTVEVLAPYGYKYFLYLANTEEEINSPDLLPVNENLIPDAEIVLFSDSRGCE